MPQCLKRFLGNFNVVASQNSFCGFRNATNVQDNCKTSNQYLIHQSVIQRSKWFATVTKESFQVANVTSWMLLWEKYGSEAGERSFKALELFSHSDDKGRTIIM